MTNTTQCPACQTRFKVSDTQLAAANGLVRCGRCAHVFNAIDHFVDPPSVAPKAPRQTPPAAPGPAPAPRPVPVQAPRPVPAAQPEIGDIDDFELEVPDFDPATAALPESPLPDYPEEPGNSEVIQGPSLEDVEAFQQALNQALQGQPVSTPIGNPFNDDSEHASRSGTGALEDELEDDVTPAIFDTRRTAQPTPAHAPLPESGTGARKEPVFEPASPDPLPADAPADEPLYDPAIGHEPVPAQRRNPLLTVLILFVSLIGLILLAGQLIYINRTQIAAQAPDMRPILEKLCKPMRCTIPLPTDQEFIRTEWSELSFVPEHSNLVQLSATLKNHAPYPQAYPILEVTLKDSTNLVLIRKVFTPAEYLKPASPNPRGFAANAEEKITMRFNVGTVRAQGYSLYWFYP